MNYRIYKRITMLFCCLLVFLLLGCNTAASPESAAIFVPGEIVAPPDYSTHVYSTNYYIDPVSGDDFKDGLSSANAKKTLTFLESTNLSPDTMIAIKRGTVLRLTKTIMLKGGTSAGWVAYGSYGSGDKPIILGSAELLPAAWTETSSGSTIWYADWSSFVDTAESRSATGVEQGPRNLWFFSSSAASATMGGWGWRKQTAVISSNSNGDWYYDASAKIIYIKSTVGAPPYTEVGVNRRMFDFRGQSYIVMQDLDLRYGGGYLIAGHSASHLTFRHIDMSYFGGGTKNGSYVRLGNGIEFNGTINDVSVEDCRIHQAYDTGFDQQNTGSSPVIQQNLFFRNNLVSYAGLASFEIWARPQGSRIHNLVLEKNTFINAGRGWGYAQHDHSGQAMIGGDIVIFENDATGSDIKIQKNLFINPRMVLMCEFKTAQINTRLLLKGLYMNQNLWCTPGVGAILFQGTVDNTGTPTLGTSPVYIDLTAWKAGTLDEITGKDSLSVTAANLAAVDFINAVDPADQQSSWIWSTATNAERPQRLGSFALYGDYLRTSPVLGAGWGWAGP